MTFDFFFLLLTTIRQLYFLNDWIQNIILCHIENNSISFLELCFIIYFLK